MQRILALLLLTLLSQLIVACSIFPAQSTSVPNFTPATTPTGIPTTGGSLQVVSFTVAPNPVERGGTVKVKWNVTGASHVALWQMTYDSKLGRWYRRLPSPVTTGAEVGEWAITVPEDADRTLRFELEATDASGNSISTTSDEIQLVCHPIFFDPDYFPAWCPSAPQTTPAALQSFEHGHMVWCSDTGQVYVLLQHPERLNEWSAYPAPGQAADVGVPPAGLYAPGEHFAGVWVELDEHLQSTLGWATAPEQTYVLTSQLSLSSGFYMGLQDDLFLSWPDGQVAHLSVYLSAPNHDNGPAWTFITP
jgi:hypothetical protein